MQAKIKNIAISSLISLSALVSLTSTANAQDKFPTKSVVAIVPFGAGGGNDILLRLLAKYSNEYLGQSLIIENKPGASGQIGWTALAKARPDGYTIGATSFPSMVLIKALRPETPFALSDFTYICNVQIDPIIWVVQADSPFKTGKDFVEAAKKSEAPINVAGDGPQSNIQLQHLVATQALNVKTNFVPFNGSSAAITALLGGKVELAATTLSAARANLDGGKLRALVVFSDAPVPLTLTVPAATSEFGLDIASVGMAMRGIAAPKGVSAEKIKILEKACQQIVESKPFLEESNRLGLLIQFMGTEKATASVAQSVKAVDTLKELLK